MRSLISGSYRRFAIILALVAALALPGVASAASTFYVRGGGNGHGVGMSQYGAYGYALHGKSYKFILAHYYQGTTLQTTNPARIVRVLLATGSAAFSGATRAGTKTLKAGKTYSVRTLADGSLQIINPKGKAIGTFPTPLTVNGPGPLNVVGLGSYRGSLQFRPDGSGGVETIDAIGVDAYVRGVVASEMPASWSPQALDAQAVAARTYALTSDVGGSAYGLYSDTRSQAYGGVAAETPSTDAAVAATRGQIVTYNGAPAISYFASSSGGYTEDVQNAFPGASPEPWLVGVPDPYDGAGGDPYHRWTYQMSVAAAAAKLGGLVNGSLIGIQITKRGVSPRILTAAVVGTNGRTTVTGSDLQQRFGLLSTLARFTTITTYAGTTSNRAKLPASGHIADLTRITAETAKALAAQVHLFFAPATRVLYGSIFPTRKGISLQVQRLGAHGRFNTIQSLQLGVGGGYDVRLPGAGTYRVVYSGLHGPAVSAP